MFSIEFSRTYDMISLGTTPGTTTCDRLVCGNSNRCSASFPFFVQLFVQLRVHLIQLSQMTPANSPILHWKALVTAILTVVALIATTTTKAANTPNRQADYTVPTIPLEMIRESATISHKAI
jgi:hypothetical protein